MVGFKLLFLQNIYSTSKEIYFEKCAKLLTNILAKIFLRILYFITFKVFFSGIFYQQGGLKTYKSIVRPVLEYASPIWSPIISESNWNRLQRIQNSAKYVQGNTMAPVTNIYTTKLLCCP